MSIPFVDHFSATAGDYARFRPTYPEALFEAIVRDVPRRERAWDCATGSGQAFAPLASRFALVVASDASARQLREVEPLPNVRCVVARAERVPLASAAFDLVTVAQALHWFADAAFYRMAAIPGRRSSARSARPGVRQRRAVCAGRCRCASPVLERRDGVVRGARSGRLASSASAPRRGTYRDFIDSRRTP